MSRPSLRLPAIVGTSICLGALAIAGCGSSSPAASADATCGDFGKMSDSDQKETAQLVLQDNGVATDGLGAGVKIQGALVALKAYCKASGDTATVNNVTDIGSALDSLREQAENAAGTAGETTGQ